MAGARPRGLRAARAGPTTADVKIWLLLYLVQGVVWATGPTTLDECRQRMNAIQALADSASAYCVRRDQLPPVPQEHPDDVVDSINYRRT